MNNASLLTPFNVVALLCAVAIISTVFTLWARSRLFYDVTLDDVMKSPDTFFHNSQWDAIVADLVVEEAAIRAMELTTNAWQYSALADKQEAEIWAILNQKLEEVK